MKAYWLLMVVSLPLTVMSYCPDKCLCLRYSDHSLTINCSGSEQTEVPYGIDPQPTDEVTNHINEVEKMQKFDTYLARIFYTSAHLKIHPHSNCQILKKEFCPVTDDLLPNIVKILDLSYNEIRTYNHSKYLKAVEEVDLSNNKISQASFGGSFNYLQYIDLSYNSFTDLKKIDIEKLPHLKKLNVSHNSKLQNISGLKSNSLEYLNLSHCSISLLNEKFLKNLPVIKSLDISFNSFQTLKNIQSDTLENLDVSHGSVKNLTKFEIYNLPDLKKLNVSFNPNLKIDFSYEKSCWDVEELDLSNSDIDSLEEMFPFCSLETLNASLNNIQIIEVRTFFNNCELNSVNLSNNQISEVHSRSFFTTQKLKVLDLSVNLIQNVDFTIYLKQVTDLDLSRNQISNLTRLVLKNVVNLNLAHNKIKDISINLNENAPKVEKINFSFNKIKNILKISSNSVSRLDLSHCRIAYVDIMAFEGAENLMEINLAGNKLTTLDFRIFSHLENLNELILGRNEWACNCHSKEFKELYEFLSVDRPLTNIQELTCVKSNETWKNTCTDTWHREKEWKKTVYSLTVSLAIAVIVVAVIFFCKYFNDKKQVEGSGRRHGRRGENAESRPSSNEISITSINLITEQEIPNRSSTPPPNYEAALLLPKLTEAQRNLAISTLSIASPTTGNEQTEETEETENQESNRNNN